MHNSILSLFYNTNIDILFGGGGFTGLVSAFSLNTWQESEEVNALAPRVEQ